MKAESSFIGIDYHKRYSVFCVLDAQGEVLERGRIDHLYPEQFIALVGRWPRCRVVFEACMNWHWLLEILEDHAAGGHRAGQCVQDPDHCRGADQDR
jgi:hypothetical protein